MPWPFKAKTKEPEIAVQVKKEVAEALEHMMLQGNNVDDAGIRQRIGQAISGGYDFADTMHNIYLDYGYPASLNFNNYWNMYRRFGIARNIVELPVDTGWMNLPTIEGEVENFNTEFEKLVKQVSLWDRMRALDNRQRVGRYAGMFIRVRDNLEPSAPIVEGSLTSIGTVIQLIPIYEGQLTISTTQDDIMADDFGMPTLYNFNSGSTGNRNEKLTTSFNIHPSRIVIAAEGADNGGIYGISSLEAPYNSLMDLRKIIGAGGEGFYRNAAQNLIHELADGASAAQNETLLNKFNEASDDFMMNRFRRNMWTPGMKTKVLESNMGNPKDPFACALNDVAAASKIPATILIGQQTGRLASTEDSKQFLSGINSRRENFMSEMTRDVIDWFIVNGVLPATEYEIEWTDLLELSQADRLTNSKSMADTNRLQFQSNQDPVFSPEEIREQAGFDPEELPEPEGEELPEDEGKDNEPEQV